MHGRDRGRLFNHEHGEVLAEASLRIDTGPFLASLLGGSPTALSAERIDPQSRVRVVGTVALPRLCFVDSSPLAVMMMN